MASKRVLQLAAIYDRELQAEYAAYLEEREQDWRRGYRAHYCEHGTNLWTDYDPICGYCEDGWSLSNGVQRMTLAIQRAREFLRHVHCGGRTFHNTVAALEWICDSIKPSEGPEHVKEKLALIDSIRPCSGEVPCTP